MLFKLIILISSVVFMVNCDDISFDSTAISSHNDLFTVIGKLNTKIEDFDFENTRILVDDGLFVGYLRADGSFSISGIPSNSYIVEVSSPKTAFEPVRVDITSKGKIRSRRLNLIQPADVQTLRYPLNFDTKGYPNYFHKREQFRIMDILFSPMVLMMVVPLLLMLVLPKLINQDPELQRELQQSTMLPTRNMPDLSEMAYNVFGRNANAKPSPSSSNRQQSSSSPSSSSSSTLQQRRVNH